jgi:hypothetical protein
MKSTTHTITTTASKIVEPNAGAQTIYIHIGGNGIVYLGGSDVTSTNGMPTEKHAVPIEIFVPRGNELWAVTGTGTETLKILQENGAS